MRILPPVRFAPERNVIMKAKTNHFQTKMQQYIVFIRILWISMHLSFIRGHPERSLQQENNMGYGNVSGPNVFVELTFQDIFVEDCKAFLLSNTNLDDEVISQMEYGEFLKFVCEEQGGCVDWFSYDAVNDKLQSLFLNVACPDSSEYNVTSCLQEYQDLGPEYGILLDRDSLVDISNRILWLCMSSFQIIRQEGLFQDQPKSDISANATQPLTQGEIQSMGPTVPPTFVRTTMLPTQVTSTVAPTQLTTTMAPTQVTTGTNETQASDEVVPSNGDDPLELGLGPVIMLICVGVVILFCLAAAIAGRPNHPNYDINQLPYMPTTSNKDTSLRWEHYSATEEEG